jgi:prolycopene isomerase
MHKKRRTSLFQNRNPSKQWAAAAVGLFLLGAIVSSSCACPDRTTGPKDAHHYEVIIVGAGAGGLGAGATLAKAGVKTLVLEQHDKPGGYMTAFEREEYRFEVSLHMMDGLDPGGWTRELFSNLGVLDKVKPIKYDPLYRVVYPDLTLDVPARLDDYLATLQATFPGERDNIARLFDALLAITADLRELQGVFEKDSVLKWARLPLVPLLDPDLWKNRNASAGEIVDRFIADPRARAVVLQLACFLGLPPSRASGLYFAGMWESYHRGGAYHFTGGSQAVSNALAEVIVEHGGEIRLNTLVKRILVENGRAFGVETATGERIYSDYVISNADGYKTFLHLVGKEHLDKKFVAWIENLKAGSSLTQVYLGVNLDMASKGLGRIGEIFYNPSFDVEGFPEKARQMRIEEIPLAIVVYSTIDPTCAPAGKAVVTLATQTPYEWKNNWYKDTSYKAYQELKEEVARRMIAVAEKVIPGLGEAIEVEEVDSPHTMERYTLNYKGAFMGWAPTPYQSGLNRMKPKTPIDRLWLAGAWTLPGGGQSACLYSGYSTAKEILKRIR